MATGNQISTSGRGLRQQTDSPEPVSDDTDPVEGPLHREHTPWEEPKASQLYPLASHCPGGLGVMEPLFFT